MSENKEPVTYPPMPKDHWLVRRRVIIGTLLYCAVNIVYLIFYGEPDNKLQETISQGLIALALTVIVAFIGGAVVDDKFRTGSGNKF